MRRSGLPRGEVFVTTKVADTNLDRRASRPSVERSLDALGVDQVDLLLIHWPSERDAVPLEDYMTALAEAQAKGQARLIGVSNFTIDLLERSRAILGDGALATNQVEIHPYLQAPKLRDWARGDGLTLTAYQPLVRGRVRGRPGARRASASGTASSPAAVALAFLMAEGHAVIPASSSAAHLRDNLAARGRAARRRTRWRAIRALDRGHAHASTRPSRRSGTTDMGSVAIRDVRKAYGSVEVLHGVSIDIADGEFVVLVGPSGCGKSTLLRMLAGLEEITSGDVAIDGRVVNALPPKARDIAMVFQTYALYPHMTVSENMGFSLKLARAPMDERRARVGKAAGILGLDAYLARYPRQLSGGQRQRVAMGRAMVRDPKVFLFDEPLSNLDAKLRVAMRSEIKLNHQRLKTTTVYVTHDQIEAMTMADRIVVMHDGIVEQIGTPLELYDRPGQPLRRRLHRLALDERARRPDRGRRLLAADGTRIPLPRPAPEGAARHPRHPPRALPPRPAGPRRRDRHRRADRLRDAGAHAARRPERRRRLPRAHRRPAGRDPPGQPRSRAPASLRRPDRPAHHTGLNAMPASYPDLKDKVVLVTGGASGIGATLVEAFAAQGARVGFLDIDAAAGARRSPSASATRVRFEACDLRDIAALKAAVGRVRAALGPITGLLNNAAHDGRHATLEVTPEYFDERIAVNFQPPVLRRPGGHPRHAGGRRRRHRLLQLHRPHARHGRHAGLRRLEVRGDRPHCARSPATSAPTTSASTPSPPAGS